MLRTAEQKKGEWRWGKQVLDDMTLIESESLKDSATPWAVAHQALPSPGFPRQEYWSELPFPSLGDLPDPGIKPRSPTLQVDFLPSAPPGKL